MLIIDNSTKFSTAFGTVLTIFVNIQTADLIQTIILAFVGGVSSFMATLFIKYLIESIKFKFRK